LGKDQRLGWGLCSTISLVLFIRRHVSQTTEWNGEINTVRNKGSRSAGTSSSSQSQLSQVTPEITCDDRAPCAHA